MWTQNGTAVKMSESMVYVGESEGDLCGGQVLVVCVCVYACTCACACLCVYVYSLVWPTAA